MTLFVSVVLGQVEFLIITKSRFTQKDPPSQLQTISEATITPIFIENSNEVYFAFSAPPASPFVRYNLTSGTALEWNQLSDQMVRDCRTGSSTVCLVVLEGFDGSFKYLIAKFSGANLLNYSTWKWFSIQQQQFDILRYKDSLRLLLDGDTIYASKLSTIMMLMC
jgi:hypothetical protein